MSDLTVIHRKWPYYKISFSKEYYPIPSFWAWTQACFLRFVTHFLIQEERLEAKQILLGHGSSKTKDIYTHISKKSLANIKSPLDQLIQKYNTDN